jgi:carbon storage regulator
MTQFKEFVMLVLSRKQGESIVIADDIVVNVIDIGRGRVQIGVSAPPHLSVHREEIHRRIQDENGAAETIHLRNCRPALPGKICR